MNNLGCTRRNIIATAAAAALFGMGDDAAARRTFPQDARRGTIEFLDARNVKINGKATMRLAPGVRVRDVRNHIVRAAFLVKKKFVTNYVVDQRGEVHDIWLLSEEETKFMPDGKTPMPQKKGWFGRLFSAD